MSDTVIKTFDLLYQLVPQSYVYHKSLLLISVIVVSCEFQIHSLLFYFILKIYNFMFVYINYHVKTLHMCTQHFCPLKIVIIKENIHAHHAVFKNLCTMLQPYI